MVINDEHWLPPPMQAQALFAQDPVPQAVDSLHEAPKVRTPKGTQLLLLQTGVEPEQSAFVMQAGEDVTAMLLKVVPFDELTTNK